MNEWNEALFKCDSFQSTPSATSVKSASFWLIIAINLDWSDKLSDEFCQIAEQACTSKRLRDQTLENLDSRSWIERLQFEACCLKVLEFSLQINGVFKSKISSSCLLSNWKTCPSRFEPMGRKIDSMEIRLRLSGSKLNEGLRPIAGDDSRW